MTDNARYDDDSASVSDERLASDDSSTSDTQRRRRNRKINVKEIARELHSKIATLEHSAVGLGGFIWGDTFDSGFHTNIRVGAYVVGVLLLILGGIGYYTPYHFLLSNVQYMLPIIWALEGYGHLLHGASAHTTDPTHGQIAGYYFFYSLLMTIGSGITVYFQMDDCGDNSQYTYVTGSGRGPGIFQIGTPKGLVPNACISNRASNNSTAILVYIVCYIVIGCFDIVGIYTSVRVATRKSAEEHSVLVATASAATASVDTADPSQLRADIESLTRQLSQLKERLDHIEGASLGKPSNGGGGTTHQPAKRRGVITNNKDADK